MFPILCRVPVVRVFPFILYYTKQPDLILEINYLFCYEAGKNMLLFCQFDYFSPGVFYLNIFISTRFSFEI